MTTKIKRVIRKLILILLFVMILASQIFSQSAGNSGLSFLKFGFGARNIAMGDAGASASNDLSALYYNPSRLVSAEMNEVIFMHKGKIKMRGSPREIMDSLKQENMEDVFLELTKEPEN